MIKRVKIFGYGEIGRSLYKLYLRKVDEPDDISRYRILAKDLNFTPYDERCDLLHVCIPFTEKFVNTCIKEIQLSEAKYVVIHSTVKPGTTEILSEEVDAVVVHSPVIGVHPNLLGGLLTFKKWVGIPEEYNEKDVKPIIDHLQWLDLNTQTTKAIASELFKIMDTSYYGMCLAFNAEARELFEKYGIDYTAWVDYLHNYNRGYEKLEMGHVRRPVFSELKMPIGGHCVGPNAEILENLLTVNHQANWIAQTILKWSNHETDTKEEH